MILTRDRLIVFANYSLEGAEVSRTAAVYSEDSLLFVVGNKVRFVISTTVCLLYCLSFRGQKGTGAQTNVLTQLCLHQSQNGQRNQENVCAVNLE